MARINEFKKYNTFFSLLKTTEKYKELYSEHSARVAIILTIIFTGVLCLFYNTDNIAFFYVVNNVLLTFSAGLLGLLGVYITGTALMVSVISQNTLEMLERSDKIESLVGILFCFYFAGAILLITLVDFILCYLLIQLNIMAYDFIVYCLIAVSCFLFLFSLSYTVALLGTCINIFFANAHINIQETVQEDSTH